MKQACRLSLLFIAVFATACSTPGLRINNYSFIYNRKDLLLQPEYRIFHKSTDSTSIYFRVNTENLLYTRTEKKDDFSARFKIEYKIFNELDEKVPLMYDSAEFIDTDNDQVKKDLIGKFDVSLPPGRNYFAAVRATDKNRGSTDIKILRIYKHPQQISSQSVLLFDRRTNVPQISVTAGIPDSLYARYTLSDAELLHVKFYPGDFPVARPPFDIATYEAQDFKPLSVTPLHDSSGFFPVVLSRNRGIYQFVADPESTAGLSVFRFNENFPSVAEGEQMLGPLRYLTSNEEFEQLKKAPNPKIAAENFWIQHCGSRERAREIIRAFYGRVQDANEFFTSYREGWKTDRGMIYIIFGPPDGLFIKENAENWVYGQETNVMSLNFNFYKQDNNFSDNEYLLERSQAYRSTWYTAVDAWRSGRLFSL